MTKKTVAKSKVRTTRAAERPIDPADIRRATARAGIDATHAVPPPPDQLVTLDREWLRERLEWLDVNRFAMKIVREVHELATSHNMSFDELVKLGLYSRKSADYFKGAGLATEHDTLAALRSLVESIENFTDEMRDAMNLTQRRAS